MSFFCFLLSPEFLPVSRPSEWWCTSTLGASLLCSSWAGFDLELVDNELILLWILYWSLYHLRLCTHHYPHFIKAVLLKISESYYYHQLGMKPGLNVGDKKSQMVLWIWHSDPALSFQDQFLRELLSIQKPRSTGTVIVRQQKDLFKLGCSRNFFE